MSLVEFLLARIAEDEAAARAASPGPWHTDAEASEVLAVDDILVADGFALSSFQLRATTRHIARRDPARVLAECEAKRELVTNLMRVCEDGRCWQCGSANILDLRDAVMLTLALPYASHSDYQAWWAK